jgi:hypothetical protein
MIALNIAGISEELKRASRWVLWQMEDVQDGEKLRKEMKPPKDAKNGEPAKHNDFSTWASFDVAHEAHEKNLPLKPSSNCVAVHPVRGIGCVIGPPFFGIDLDDIRDPATGVIEPEAQAFIKEVNSLTEISPSGTGVHIWGHGEPPYPEGHRKDGREVYSCNRYLTVTGAVLEGHEEIRRFTPAEVKKLYELVKNGKAKSMVHPSSPREGSGSYTAAKLAAMKSQTDIADYSQFVQSFLTLAAIETYCDSVQMERLFKETACYQTTHWKEKWERLGPAELAKAIEYGRDNLKKMRTAAPGEEIPADVDLNAPDFVDEPGKRLLFPDTAMYGKAGELARKTDTDAGYAYLAVIAMAAGRGIEPHPQVRPTAYVSLLGDVGWGKSISMQRAGALFGFPTEASTCIERFPDSYEPDGNKSLFLQLNLSSDRGLYKALEGEKTARPAIIAVDELRNLLAKSNIENSCLFTVLCSLYNLDEAGFADKKGKDFIRVRLSLLGCLKVADENEFPEVFTQATSSGFYDRMLFGVAEKRVVWKPWHPGVYQHVEFSQPVIPEWVFGYMSAAFGEKGNRFLENALRVIYITAAINGDTEVGIDCVLAAWRFMLWQERIRNVFKPAKGANEHQECVDTVVQAFREAPGRAANWRTLARKKRWDRKFPRSLASVKRLLEDMGRLTKDKETGKHFLREEV